MHKLHNILVLEKNYIICTSVFYTDLYLEGTFQDTSKSFKPTEVGFEISINWIRKGLYDRWIVAQDLMVMLKSWCLNFKTCFVFYSTEKHLFSLYFFIISSRLSFIITNQCWPILAFSFQIYTVELLWKLDTWKKCSLYKYLPCRSVDVTVNTAIKCTVGL